MQSTTVFYLVVAFMAYAAEAANSMQFPLKHAADMMPFQRDLQFESCHCDGDVVHCNSANEEAACFCEEGTAYCDLALLDTSKPWGPVILAAVIVNLVTLIGVIFIAGEYLRKLCCPSWMSGDEAHKSWTHVYIPMFACGALLATTFFLILPESLLLIQADFLGDGEDGHNHRRGLQEEEDHSGEGAATWRFGTAIIGGFLIPVVSHVFFPHQELHDHPFHHQGKPVVEKVLNDDAATQLPDQSKPLDNMSSGSIEGPVKDPHGNPETVEDNLSSSEEGKHPVDSSLPKEPKYCGMRITNPSLVASIFLGDFFHNFADGIFIGTAFLLCERSLAITITAATIWHELAQEVADYFLLVHHCGMSRCAALTINFLCGLSITFGGLLVLSVEMPSSAIGIILCIGAGVYVHVAVADCLSTAKKHEKGRKHKLLGIVAFICGVIPIGLVLLNHQHCGGH